MAMMVNVISSVPYHNQKYFLIYYCKPEKVLFLEMSERNKISPSNNCSSKHPCSKMHLLREHKPMWAFLKMPVSHLQHEGYLHPERKCVLMQLELLEHTEHFAFFSFKKCLFVEANSIFKSAGADGDLLYEQVL